MNVDWEHFTPLASLSGGLILGLAVAVFILVNGRILGISGILGGLLPPRAGDASWRIAFLLGLICAPALFHQLMPFNDVVLPRIEADDLTVVVAGFLVGIGTRYASGCTSGHGVCGLSRLSLRSVMATATFMAAGFLMVFLTRHVL